MHHIHFVNCFTNYLCITNDKNVKPLFISIKKSSKEAVKDFEMQLREIIEKFLIKRMITFFVIFDKKCHESDLAVPFCSVAHSKWQ